MAIEKTTNRSHKAMNMASETVLAVQQMMDAASRLKRLEEERSNSGLDLAEYNAAYAKNSSLQHIDGAELNDVLSTSMPATWLFWIDKFHITNFDKVLP